MDSTAHKPELKPIPANVNEIKFQETSLDIWESKYCLKSKKGDWVDKDIEDTYKRVATALSAVEKKENRDEWQEKFLWALRAGERERQCKLILPRTGSGCLGREGGKKRTITPLLRRSGDSPKHMIRIL